MNNDLRMLISLPKEMEVDFRLFIVTHGGSIENVYYKACFKEALEAFEDADEIERELLRQDNIMINDTGRSEEE